MEVLEVAWLPSCKLAPRLLVFCVCHNLPALQLIATDRLVCVAAGQLHEHAHSVQRGGGAAAAARKALQPTPAPGPVNALGGIGGVPVLRVTQDAQWRGHCTAPMHRCKVLWLHRDNRPQGKQSTHVQSVGLVLPHVLPRQPLPGLQRTFGSCFCQARILSAGATLLAGVSLVLPA